jgi:transposase
MKLIPPTVSAENSLIEEDQPNLLRQFLKGIEEFPYEKSTAPRTKSGGYGQNWSAYNTAQENEQRLFKNILKILCEMIEEPEPVRGRPPVPLKDIVYCAAFMVYNKHPARGFNESLNELMNQGYISRVPHHNTICLYLRKEFLEIIITKLIEIASLPMRVIESQFAFDSTGLTTHRYARWVDDRTKEEKILRQWVKIHLGCGVTSNIVTTAVVTRGEASDSRQFGHLVNKTACNFNMSAVSGDSAYLSGENMRYVVAAGALPLLRFKSNNVLDPYKSKSNIWENLLRLYKERHWVYMSHYNKRNNVEATFSMIKRKFGEHLLTTDHQAQISEALLKVLCHNICVLIQSFYELDVPITFPENSSVSLKKDENESTQVSIAEGRVTATKRGRKGQHKNVNTNQKSVKGSNKTYNQNQILLFD